MSHKPCKCKACNQKKIIKMIKKLKRTLKDTDNKEVDEDLGELIKQLRKQNEQPRI